MGHLAAKDIYQKLGKKIDGLTVRTPMTDTFYAILKELYSEEEAYLIAHMPDGVKSAAAIQRATKLPKEQVDRLLKKLGEKGLIIDFGTEKKRYYTISPMVIGIFEYTMMRTGETPENYKKWAKLFNEYMMGDDTFFKANFGDGQKISVMRTLPHESTIRPDSYVEILDYEKAAALIEDKDIFGLGVCSCRHEKHHLDQKKCNIPLESCATFGPAAEYMIEHGFAKAIDRSEMNDILTRSKEMGLVMNTDNVQKNANFMCHCCGCCCNLLQGLSKFGYVNTVVTSTFIADIDHENCDGCGKCAKACPIDVIKMERDKDQSRKRKKKPVVDEHYCLGCGVCALKCEPGGLRLKKREQKVLHPENTIQRVVLQALERGTLQNLIFDNPQKISHTFMRGLVGGFFKLSPVKKALMSDQLRSSFLKVTIGNKSV